MIANRLRIYPGPYWTSAPSPNFRLRVAGALPGTAAHLEVQVIGQRGREHHHVAAVPELEGALHLRRLGDGPLDLRHAGAGIPHRL